MSILRTPLAAIGPAIMLVVNLFLLSAILADVGTGDLASADKAEWNVGLSGSISGVINRKPVDAYTQILTKPVFFKSREPFVAAPPPPLSKVVPAPSLVDLNLILGGVMIEKETRKAYLFSRANSGGAWINEGDEFLGWQVRSIDGTSAKLEQKGRYIDLQLYPKD
jgi:hypothetical protein